MTNPQGSPVLIRLTPAQIEAHPDFVQYPFLAYNSTTKKLYAYTHIPEWSGVETNWFKVEGKQKRVPAEPFQDITHSPVNRVFKVTGVARITPLRSLPSQEEITPTLDIFETVNMIKTLQRRVASLESRSMEFPESRKDLAILACAEIRTRILRVSKAIREHLGIPANVQVIQNGAGYICRDGDYKDLQFVCELPNFNMCGYSRINLIDWD